MADMEPIQSPRSRTVGVMRRPEPWVRRRRFGGTFNEKGWVALSLLTGEEREAVLKAFFDPEEGARFNICRVPIGASDYAVSRYTHNETKNDYEMKNFSIARDHEYLLPYIKGAMRYRPDLKVWGSVWTPPTWMKTNGAFDGGQMKHESQSIRPMLYTWHALWKNTGKRASISLCRRRRMNRKSPPTTRVALVPQQFLVFIRDYLGPLFAERNPDAEIMLGTIRTLIIINSPYCLSDKKPMPKCLWSASSEGAGVQSADTGQFS